MKFYSIAATMTIASAANASAKVSGEDHDAIVTGLRHLVNTDDKLGDFLQDLLEGVLEKKDALAPQTVTTTVATPVSPAASKSGKAAGGSGKSGKGSKMPSSVLNGSPVLLSEESGAIVPLWAQCFASQGGRGYPCSFQQALSAALLDKDVDSRLDGATRIIYNQIEDKDDISFLKCNDSICSTGSDVDLDDGTFRRGDFYAGVNCTRDLGTCDANSGADVGKVCDSDCDCGSSCDTADGNCVDFAEFTGEEVCDDYLVYCCSDQPQFNEGTLRTD